MVEDSSSPKYRSVGLRYWSCVARSCRVSRVATSMSLCCQCCGKCCFHEPIKIPLDLSNQSDILKVSRGVLEAVRWSALSLSHEYSTPLSTISICNTVKNKTEFLYYCTSTNLTQHHFEINCVVLGYKLAGRITDSFNPLFKFQQ